MYAKLVGKKVIDYVSKKDNVRRQGIELHFVREYFPSERFETGSLVCMDPFYIGSNNQLFQKSLQVKVGSDCDIVTFQTGKFTNLVSLEVISND